MKTKRIITNICLLLTALLLASCASDKGTKIHKFEQLKGKKVAVQEGTNFDDMITADYPKVELIRVPTLFDIYRALLSGEAEYGIDDDVTAILMLSSGLGIDTAYAETPANSMGAIFHKSNTELQQKFNEFITEIEKSGELDTLRHKWFSSSAPSSLPVPKAQFTEGEPITVLIEGDYPPFDLTVHGKLSGLDAEIATMFANKMQRPIQFNDIKFQDIIPSIEAGKGDMAISGITITDERAEKVLFSKPYNNGYTLIVSMKDFE